MSKKLQTQKPSSLLGYDTSQQKQVYIYAQVDIDKLYNEIVSKSKKIQKFLQQNGLESDFLQKMRQYKHLRICFDNEIQQFIFKKELNKELKNVKKNVFVALEEFLVNRFQAYYEEENLHKQYTQKVREIQTQFAKRIQDLTKNYL